MLPWRYCYAVVAVSRNDKDSNFSLFSWIHVATAPWDIATNQQPRTILLLTWLDKVYLNRHCALDFCFQMKKWKYYFHWLVDADLLTNWQSPYYKIKVSCQQLKLVYLFIEVCELSRGRKVSKFLKSWTRLFFLWAFHLHALPSFASRFFVCTIMSKKILK